MLLVKVELSLLREEVSSVVCLLDIKYNVDSFLCCPLAVTYCCFFYFIFCTENENVVRRVPINFRTLKKFYNSLFHTWNLMKISSPTVTLINDFIVINKNSAIIPKTETFLWCFIHYAIEVRDTNVRLDLNS